MQESQRPQLAAQSCCAGRSRFAVDRSLRMFLAASATHGSKGRRQRRRNNFPQAAPASAPPQEPHSPVRVRFGTPPVAIVPLDNSIPGAALSVDGSLQAWNGRAFITSSGTITAGAANGAGDAAVSRNAARLRLEHGEAGGRRERAGRRSPRTS